jgi:lycopene cyclase domain-containing protein
LEIFETKYLYLILLLFTLSYPLAQSFETKIKYYTKWKKLLPAILAMMLLFIPWDIWFTKTGVWQFNDIYFLGYKIFHLPVEEWLFFILIPFACIFIYEVLLYFFPNQKPFKHEKIILYASAIVLFFVSILNFDKQYTFYCFFLASIALFITAIIRPNWASKFLRMYLVSLIPFILINGFLTGSFTNEPVVIYNLEEILGFRILNIPIEDTIYNMLMLLIVVFLYEK